MNLTVKQEKFAKKYIELGDASAAYRESYNIGKMPPESIHRKAHEVKSNVKVSSRIAELQAKALKKHELTVAGLLKELEEARIMASTAQTVQASAMTGATMGKAKLLGMLTDKQEITGANGGALTVKVIYE